MSNANLLEVGLAKATLIHTNFAKAGFWDVYLREAYFLGANLQGADFWMADLQGAHFTFVDLRETNLNQANLKGATFWMQANLTDANLLYADLTDTRFDNGTILPDGNQWTPTTDMRRFTDPKHPDFWYPEWAMKKALSDREK
jgi:uncharacterized protein YjbI with pentapeptide repeats